jgi:hypothetical protein
MRDAFDLLSGTKLPTPNLAHEQPLNRTLPPGAAAIAAGDSRQAARATATTVIATST